MPPSRREVNLKWKQPPAKSKLLFCTETTLKRILREDLGTVAHRCFAFLFFPVICIPQLDFNSHHTLCSSLGSGDSHINIFWCKMKLLFERLEFPKGSKFLFETNPYYLVCTCSSKRNWHRDWFYALIARKYENFRCIGFILDVEKYILFTQYISKILTSLQETAGLNAVTSKQRKIVNYLLSLENKVWDIFAFHKNTLVNFKIAVQPSHEFLPRSCKGALPSNLPDVFVSSWNSILNIYFPFICLQLQSPTASKLDPKGPKHCLFLEVCQVWTALVVIHVGTTYIVSEAVFGNILNVFHTGITQLSVWEMGTFHVSTQCSKINECHWLSLS